MRRVVDTNVPIVANGHGPGAPTIGCRKAAVEFLFALRDSGKLVLDAEGAILAEYRRHLNPGGQPGVGDQFYREALNSHPDRVERMGLPVGRDGQYIDLPHAVAASRFDQSDRKFAALARRAHVPVVNSTDSDWLDHQRLLEENGIIVEFLCGCDRDGWFA